MCNWSGRKGILAPYFSNIHLAAASESVAIDRSQDGLPDQRDIVPPVQEVLFIITLEVSVLHLLDVCPRSKSLPIKTVYYSYVKPIPVENDGGMIFKILNV